MFMTKTTNILRIYVFVVSLHIFWRGLLSLPNCNKASIPI